ncbi:chromosome segregation ATPase [Streptomyces mobaraensis]|uniref:Chromosome segregation ATPase n=1 Tax=Streptomyces mobaraensis TaxID=35621 RepID=A0A5N5VZ56_STRMB|nr:chromosome segregation ATPase [Streptomyces mobaraensis]KAB7833548.1 chromosome segregation ATPase [Streptomyces mobaraensis]
MAKNPSAKQSEGRPKWVPLRDEQYDGLTALARELMNSRDRKIERITENSVIRVAIDLVLAHPELLAGDTEDELRAHAIAEIGALRRRIRSLERLQEKEQHQTPDGS